MQLFNSRGYLQLRPCAVTEVCSGVTIISRATSLIHVFQIDLTYFAQMCVLAKFLVGSDNVTYV